MQNHSSNRVKERNSPSRPNRKAAGRPERARRSPRLVDHAIESSPSISEASTAVADAADHPSTPVVRVAPPNWNGNTKFINFAPTPKAQLSPLNTSKPQETQSEPSPQTPKLGAPTISTANSYLHSPHSGSYTDETSLEYSAFENRRIPAKMTILRENDDYPDPFNKQKSSSFFSSLAKRDSAVLREEQANSMSSPNSPHHHNNDMFNGLADLAFYSVSLEKLNSQGKFQKRLLRFDGNILLIMSKTVESTRSKQKLMEFDLMESSHSLISNDLQSYIRSNYPAGLPASLAKVILSKGSSTSPDPNSCKYYVPKV